LCGRSRSDCAPMNKSICFQICEDDYIAALRLYRLQQWWKPLVGSLAAAVIVLAFGMLRRPQPTGLEGSVLFLCAVVGGVAAYFTQTVCNFAWIQWKGRRVFRQQRVFDLLANLSWDEGGLHTHNDNGQYRHPWSDFIRWREGKRLFVLNLSDAVFLMVPKRAFPDSTTLDAFRELMKARIEHSRSVR
jgi:hypothetical protein